MNIMKHPVWMTTACVLLSAALTAWAQQPAPQPPPSQGRRPAIDAKADAMLREMSRTLAAAKGFSFASHSIADHILPSGQKVQFARNQKVTVRRPDRFRATVSGDTEHLDVVYDGKRVTLLNVGENRYSVADAKASIDQTLDMLAEEYGMALPLADLVFADPYKTLIEHVRSGEDLGVGYVFETKCRHLAFRQDTVDWQIWIDETSKLPRKIVITYKEQPAHPEFTAFLNDWDLSAKVAEGQFTFTPPAGATKAPLEAPGAGTPPAGDGK